MTIDERHREWLARVQEHKALARLRRARSLVREERGRYDALTRSLLSDLAASPVAVEEGVRVAPATLGFRTPDEGVEGVDATRVVASLRGRTEGV